MERSDYIFMRNEIEKILENYHVREIPLDKMKDHFELILQYVQQIHTQYKSGFTKVLLDDMQIALRFFKGPNDHRQLSINLLDITIDRLRYKINALERRVNLDDI